MKNNTTRFFLLSLLIILYETTTAQEIGLQLYSLRDQFAKDVPGTMAKVKGWGIKEVELGGTYGLSMENFKKLLSQNTITPISYGADF